MDWLTYHTHTSPTASWRINARRLLSASGFSLTEVMVAVVVFSLGLAGLGSMQIATIKLNSAAHITTQIATVAQDQMEALLALPFADPRWLQDNAPAVGQGTTRCVKYPPEGMWPCQDTKFKSAHPEYCTVTTQTPTGSGCAAKNFPPPTKPPGYKVQWTVNNVNVDASGNPLPSEQQLTHINITVSQKIGSEEKTYTLSFAKLDCPKDETKLPEVVCK
jgi:prepilin-type N-terminal cleavage/methylation domain-containing protein